jgi:hypothetical protein
VLFQVVGHPSGQPGQLRRRGEQLAAHRLGVLPFPQQRGYLVVQVAQHGWPGPAAAEQVVQSQECPRDFLDRLDVGLTDAAGRVRRKADFTRWGRQPSYR